MVLIKVGELDWGRDFISKGELDRVAATLRRGNPINGVVVLELRCSACLLARVLVLTVKCGIIGNNQRNSNRNEDKSNNNKAGCDVWW